MSELDKAVESRFNPKQIIKRLRVRELQEYDPFALCDALNIDISVSNTYRKIDFTKLVGSATDRQMEAMDRLRIEYKKGI